MVFGASGVGKKASMEVSRMYGPRPDLTLVSDVPSPLFFRNRIYRRRNAKSKGLANQLILQHNLRNLTGPTLQQIHDVARFDTHPSRFKGQWFAQLENMRLRARAKQIVFALPNVSSGEFQPEFPRRDKNLEKRTALYVGGQGSLIGALIDQGQEIILTRRRFDLKGKHGGQT